MFLTEYDEEKEREKLIKEVKLDVNERVATDMLLDGKPLMEILKYSQLSEDKIRQLAESLSVAVVV